MKDLQQFLQDRGVPCAGYKKKELVSMCKLAIEVDFEVDPERVASRRECRHCE